MTKKFEVTLVRVDDGPNQELLVTRDGATLIQASDCVEPEDNLFYRAWSWVPDALRSAYAYGLEDGQACVPDGDWGCDARKKLGAARGALMTAKEDLEELLAALMPVMMAACQSDGARRLFVESINKLEAAVEATGMPQPCGAKEGT